MSGVAFATPPTAKQNTTTTTKPAAQQEAHPWQGGKTSHRARRKTN